MNHKPVILMGNGGHARVLMDALLLQRRDILGFTAPEKQVNPFNLEYLGTDDVILQYAPDEVELVNAIGSVSNTAFRKQIFGTMKKANYVFSSVVHPRAYLAHGVQLGEGCQILAGVVIQPFSNISDNSIINTNASIDHDCHIGAHSHIAPGTTISGMVTIGNSTHIGTGTTLIQNVEVGNHVLVGAGSVVIRNISSGKTAYGVPAKEV